jgi:hypothetical protein
MVAGVLGSWFVGVSVYQHGPEEFRFYAPSYVRGERGAELAAELACGFLDDDHREVAGAVVQCVPGNNRGASIGRHDEVAETETPLAMQWREVGRIDSAHYAARRSASAAICSHQRCGSVPANASAMPSNQNPHLISPNELEPFAVWRLTRRTLFG